MNFNHDVCTLDSQSATNPSFDFVVARRGLRLVKQPDVRQTADPVTIDWLVLGVWTGGLCSSAVFWATVVTLIMSTMR